ncbi:MAG: translocation/assembly module TamB domain-containing protein [Longimicrobiales bacterium]|nr:translocation/assembly module TamB domain-containing protein [Longimicrobiales bacterium]
MAVARRFVRWLGLGVAGLVVLLLVALAVLTQTPVGVERAGRFAVDRIQRSINGELSVARFSSRGLLQGVTLHEVRITGPDGRLFLRADSARLSYSIPQILAGAVVFDRLALFGPDVVVERLPGDDLWNYDRILSDTTAADTAPPRREGRILIRDATVREGRATVRLPWEGGDTSRVIVESVPGGRVRTLRFDSIDARLPRVAWESPELDGRVLEIGHLAARAYVWDTPVEVEGLEGTVTIRDSIVGFDAHRVRLPGSELSVKGRVVVGASQNRYELTAEGDDLAFRDFRWLYPSLPGEGGGALRFRLETLPSGATLFLARDARLASRGSELAGSFGVIVGDGLRFTDVDIRATPLDLALVDTLTEATVPVSGLLIGTLRGEGPAQAFRSEGDLRYRTFDAEGNGAESSVRWSGVIGLDAPFPVADLDATLESVDMAQVAQFVPAVRIGGVADGTLRARGSLRDGLRVEGRLALDHGGNRSAVSGSGRMALGETATFDLQFDAEPLALQLLGQQFAALQGLRGETRGPITLSGTPNDLTLGVDLATPAGGVVLQGRMAVNGRTEYQAEGSVTEFRLDRVLERLPETTVTGRFELEGSAFDPAEIETRLSVDVLTARVDGVEVYRGAFRGSVSDAVARIDSVSITTEVGDLTAQGTFGLLEGRSGELAVNVVADSLVFLEPLLFGEEPPLDIGLERLNRVDGRIRLDGQLVGSVQSWRASGRARIRSLVYDQLQLGRGTLDVTWDADTLRAQATVDSLEYADRRLAEARASATYAGGEGVVAATLRGRGSQQLELETTFRPQGRVLDLGLQRLRLETRDGRWVLTNPAVATVGASGFSVDSLVLVRSPAAGRLRVTGVLPWRQPEADEVQEASLAVELDGLRLDEFLRVAQSDTVLGGVVSGGLRVNGTALQPRIDGRLSARPFRYQGAELDSVQVGIAYADREVEGVFTGWKDRATILSADLRVPVQLALTAQEDRFLDRPMDLTIRAEGMPAALASFMAPGFSGLRGRIAGEVNVVGTPVNPDLQGELRLTDGAAYFDPLAVAYREIQATARMTAGTTVEIDAAVRTENGRGRVQGTLDLTEPADPAFDLVLDAQRLDASRRSDVTAVVDGLAQLRGRYTRPIVTGDVQVVRGEMDLDEIWRQRQIVQLDTTLFQMLDTTQVSYRPRPESPFLENLRVTNMDLRLQRNFWLRSQELNVEVGGALNVEVDRRTDELRMTGTLQVIEGSYTLLASRMPVGGRRFDIRSGTIEFVGTPGIDPNLDITAGYRVRRAQGEPLTILAQVAGTLQDPRVELTSTAEVPMSETDLASYILFGRAGAELTQAEQDMASAGGSLAYSLSRPLVSGAASSGLQQVAASLGLPIDYISLSLPEYGTEFGQAWAESRAAAFWRNAQIEVGFDPAPNVSVIGSVRIPSGTPREERSELRLFGARVEYRPWETWTFQGYIEDQFARIPSFGPAEISDYKVLGLSVYREWGY